MIERNGNCADIEWSLSPFRRGYMLGNSAPLVSAPGDVVGSPAGLEDSRKQDASDVILRGPELEPSKPYSFGSFSLSYKYLFGNHLTLASATQRQRKLQRAGQLG